LSDGRNCEIEGAGFTGATVLGGVEVCGAVGLNGSMRAQDGDATINDNTMLTQTMPAIPIRVLCTTTTS
jgi:hypothetical protein